ncbi:DUF4870 domain-containing protein [Psychrobacillus glaciei]|uniref:DUF4870 domain-containing protein n=1 Tax=Psychrobacillus glaciei TaxID=2283160 RepID=A0A5J6SRF8_9BACI|nr:DUF4870 domain-containing protein [Psychrobacillus glaciei]QFG00220.1 DUF4870 domain-containing protein [Psychrobacillus glaciei]
MENNKLLSALSYFSVLFAPLILPIIVFFITHDTKVKQHAKRSLISHLIPIIFMIILFIVIYSSVFSMSYSSFNQPSFFMTSGPLLLVFLYLIIYIITLIWNIIQGVKVLR